MDKVAIDMTYQDQQLSRKLVFLTSQVGSGDLFLAVYFSQQYLRL